MPRPKRKRRILQAPKAFGFKPITAKDKVLEFDIALGLEEYESLRLADYEGLSHEEASSLMQVSRPTFTRIYELARRKMVKALVENKPLLIAGGDVDFDKEWYRCHDCDDVFSDGNHSCESENEKSHSIEHINSSLNNGLIDPEIILPPSVMGYCTCPECHFTQPKIQAIPCRTQKCPKCGRDTMIKTSPKNHNS